MSQPAAVSAVATPEEVKATPIFGSGSAFGAGTGFAGFTGAVTPIGADANQADAAEGDEGANPEEECQAEFKPVVQLDEVETSTGEEEETSLLELKCKLYRFDTGSNEWKERGIGFVKLLQHKENKKIRLLMRQEKTLKIRANHIVMPNAKLQEHTGSDKAWVWSTVDFADEEQRVELFCIRFGTAEKAQDFKKQFELAVDHNTAILGPVATKELDETELVADKLADAVEQVEVNDQ